MPVAGMLGGYNETPPGAEPVVMHGLSSPSARACTVSTPHTIPASRFKLSVAEFAGASTCLELHDNMEEQQRWSNE